MEIENRSAHLEVMLQKEQNLFDQPPFREIINEAKELHPQLLESSLRTMVYSMARGLSYKGYYSVPLLRHYARYNVAEKKAELSELMDASLEMGAQLIEFPYWFNYITSRIGRRNMSYKKTGERLEDSSPSPLYTDWLKDKKFPVHYQILPTSKGQKRIFIIEP